MPWLDVTKLYNVMGLGLGVGIGDSRRGQGIGGGLRWFRVVVGCWGGGGIVVT